MDCSIVYIIIDGGFGVRLELINRMVNMFIWWTPQFRLRSQWFKIITENSTNEWHLIRILPLISDEIELFIAHIQHYQKFLISRMEKRMLQSIHLLCFRWMFRSIEKTVEWTNQLCIHHNNMIYNDSNENSNPIYLWFTFISVWMVWNLECIWNNVFFPHFQVAILISQTKFK